MRKEMDTTMSTYFTLLQTLDLKLNSNQELQ